MITRHLDVRVEWLRRCSTAASNVADALSKYASAARFDHVTVGRALRWVRPPTDNATGVNRFPYCGSDGRLIDVV